MHRKFLVSISLFIFFAVWNPGNAALADESVVPEPFRQFDACSERAIDYDFLTLWLKTVVVDIGRSNRGKAAPVHARIGTRIKPKINRATIYEGNRVYYEAFKDNDEAKQLLSEIRRSLEQLPDVAPLKYFNRSEQLAYWLNLYNFTLMDEIVRVYPERNLEDWLAGDDSILKRKLLKVSGIPLSLNDIQNTILKQNYDNDPLILYGLYQGIVGGPSIRNTAYTGANVYRALADNAAEFVNSNRGTSGGGKRYTAFNVSSFYARNANFFPEFDSDLTTHLLRFLEGSERERLASATALRPVINDWTVTDLIGTYPEIHIGAATNPAALLGALRSTTPADPIEGAGSGGFTGAAASNGSSAYLAKASRRWRHDPDAFGHLLILNARRIEANRTKAKVTIEDLEESAIDSDDRSEIRD